MSVNNHRRCAKCGKTRNQDMTVTYHRFPNPRVVNLTKARAWAKYCWPDGDWSSQDFLCSLYSTNKVLCGRHFDSSDFYDNKRQKLSKFAVPKSTAVSELLDDREFVFKEDSSGCGERQDSKGDKQTNESVPTESVNDAALEIDNIENDIDNDDNSLVPDPNQETGENPNPGQFSWNKKLVLEPDRDLENDCSDVLMFSEGAKEPEPQLEADTIKGVHDAPKADHNKEDVHEGFSCDICGKTIHGFRYTCVQCPDWDACGACEARGVHARHYVLRVPGPRPQEQVQAILQSIRLGLSQGAAGAAHWVPQCTNLEEVKEELKTEEDPFGSVSEELPLESDADEEYLEFESSENYSRYSNDKTEIHSKKEENTSTEFKTDTEENQSDLETVTRSDPIEICQSPPQQKRKQQHEDVNSHVRIESNLKSDLPVLLRGIHLKTRKVTSTESSNLKKDNEESQSDLETFTRSDPIDKCQSPPQRKRKQQHEDISSDVRIKSNFKSDLPVLLRGIHLKTRKVTSTESSNLKTDTEESQSNLETFTRSDAIEKCLSPPKQKRKQQQEDINSDVRIESNFKSDLPVLLRGIHLKTRKVKVIEYKANTGIGIRLGPPMKSNLITSGATQTYRQYFLAKSKFK